MSQNKQWALVAIPSAVIIIAAVFACDAAHGIEAKVSRAGTFAPERIVTEALNDTAGAIIEAELGPGLVVTDTERGPDGLVIRYERAHGDLCPQTTEPWDRYAGILWAGHSHGQGYWTYGPWNASQCSTETRITWTNWSRPGHSTGPTCCWFWDGDKVVNMDKDGDTQHVLRQARFVHTSANIDNPRLRLIFGVGQRIDTEYSCGNC